MARFELTPAAELDLLNIACFGMARFGVGQSELYRDRLYQPFQALAEAPLHYSAVDYIRQGYRRSVCGSHSIYYRVHSGYVEIMRVIGKRIFKESLIQAEHLNGQAGLFAESRQHPDQPIQRAFVNPAFNDFRYSTCLLCR